MAAFNKVAMFTDIHFGEDGNSKHHNELCIAFIKWFIEECKRRGVNLIIFGGDWHHARSQVGAETLKYSYRGTKLLDDCGIPVIFIIGNHDLFYRDNRSVHSLPWLESMDNITVIDQPTVIDDTLLVPWICPGDKLSNIAQEKVKYAFGHFELPGFLMNEKYAFPDKEGILKGDDMKHPDYVFSGHFHARQKRTTKSGTQIHYIGNPFPHNFNDVRDRDRGMMVLEHGEEPEYVNWPDAPYYDKIKLSEFLANPDQYDSNSHIKIIQDIDLTSTERDELKQSVADTYGIVNLSIEPDKSETLNEGEVEDIEDLEIDSIEHFVVEWIKVNETERSDDLIDIFIRAEVAA